jgi:mono/diheme cytochrome c family protein
VATIAMTVKFVRRFTAERQRHVPRALGPLPPRAAAAAIGLALLAGYPGTASPADPGPTPYRITDGRVDEHTYNGFRRYNAVCNHCHGPDGAGGAFGPSLVEALPPPDAFRAAVLEGRATGSAVMTGFAADPNVAPHVDDIYAYLRARADGALGRGRPLRAAEP